MSFVEIKVDLSPVEHGQMYYLLTKKESLFKY